MIIGRVFGYLSLSLMIIVLGAEGLRFLEGGQSGLLSISDVIDFFQETEIESEKSEDELGQYLSPIFNFSAFFSFLLIGGLCTFLFRKKN